MNKNAKFPNDYLGYSISSSSLSIPIIDGNNISKEEFTKLFILKRKPCIINNLNIHLNLHMDILILIPQIHNLLIQTSISKENRLRTTMVIPLVINILRLLFLLINHSR